MATIGFIGLGNMGTGMAANLVKVGHTVRAFDVSQAALSRTAEIGVAPARSVTDVASGADVVITMLQSGEQVREVYEKEAFTAASTMTILIECSTIDVATARAMGETAKARGQDDEPVVIIRSSDRGRLRGGSLHQSS
jgi:3-hydroxyisobutyrate dehydrogenase